ncbi:MAG: hypothetical protein HKN62_09865 [Phycisphaerales bacterium]|nr:hypothetical protein [Phycisphaerales bacterium]
MNGAIDRKLVAEFAILVALCVGGWVMFVEPMISELVDLQAKINEAQNNPILRNHESVADMAGQLDDVRAEIDLIGRQSSFGRDSHTMYGLIKDLAAEHGVAMRRLDPGSNRRGDDDSPVQVTNFVMRVEARYDQLANFLEAIDSIDGFVRPVSLTLAPKGHAGDEFVDAQFSCEAVSFTLPEALASMVEENDAQQ